MIEIVRGRLLAVADDSAVIEVGGIALRLLVPVPVAEELAQLLQAGDPGPEVKMFTHFLLRPDSWQLFGFPDEEGRRLFRILLGIPGVGPRMAISLLSHLSTSGIHAAVEAGDSGCFEAVPGIGKRMAGRIVHELRGKVAGVAGISLPVATSGPTADARDALVALGLGHSEALALVRAAVRRIDSADDTAALVAEALRMKQRKGAS